MGRAKLEMQLLTKEKKRNTTYKKRKEGLVRKMNEFTILCDVKACLIIYPLKQEKENNSSSAAEVWPEIPDYVSSVIERHKDSSSRNFTLLDFFHGREKKVKDELEKKRKKRLELVYPTWVDSMSYLSDTQMRDFAITLGDKLDFVKRRIESIKAILTHPHQYYPPPPLVQRNLEWNFAAAPLNPNEMQVPLLEYYQSNIDEEQNHLHLHHQQQQQQQIHSVMNPDSMMMGRLMNDDENDHYLYHHGNPSNCNFQYSSFKHDQILYAPPLAMNGGGGQMGMIENAGGIYGFPMTILPHYYQPQTLQPHPMGACVQYPTMNEDVHIQPNLQS